MTMSTDLRLRRRADGAPLTPKNVELAFAEISRASELRVALAANVVRFRIALDEDDPEVAAIRIAFSRSGDALSGSASGRGAPLLYWSFHRLAAQLGCELEDPQADDAGGVVTPDADRYFAEARALIAGHEEDVMQGREEEDEVEGDEEEEDDDDGEEDQIRAFVGDLVRTGKVLLVSDEAAEYAVWSGMMEDPEALYEAIIESDAVDEVFLSESEFTDLLRKFHAAR
jgi:hypothetical protein